MRLRSMHAYFAGAVITLRLGALARIARSYGLRERIALLVFAIVALIGLGRLAGGAAAIAFAPPIYPAADAPRLTAAQVVGAPSNVIAAETSPSSGRLDRREDAPPQEGMTAVASATSPAKPDRPRRGEKGLIIDLRPASPPESALRGVGFGYGVAAPPLGLLAPRADVAIATPRPDEASWKVSLERLPEAIAARVSSEAPELIEAYAARGYAPFFAGWIDASTGLEAAVERLRTDAAPTDGLAEAIDRIDAALSDPEAFTPENKADLDVTVAKAVLLYARRISGGALAPRSIDTQMDLDRPIASAQSVFAVVVAAPTVADAIENLAPRSPGHDLLRRAFAVWSAAALNDPSAGTIAPRGVLRPGDRAPEVRAVRRRLAALNGFAAEIDGVDRALPPTVTPDVYDEPLADAIRAFQRRRGLADDGAVGPKTRVALNKSAAALARSAAANLERARWLNKPLGDRRIEVNIPDFHARLIDGGETIFKTRVVVGKAGRSETPEFSDQMTYVVVNPRWHVPYSIATQEILPALQANPFHLVENNMTLMDASGAPLDATLIDWNAYSARSFPFRIRQESGPGNALGDVKFIFPNHHAVYLHDTPSRSLFGRAQRDFSHGCVRVADPTALAETLLSAQSPDAPRLYQRLRRATGERHAKLNDPVPVHLFYRTVWVDDDGGLQIRGDVYGRDEKVARALRDSGVELPDDPAS